MRRRSIAIGGRGTCLCIIGSLDISVSLNLSTTFAHLLTRLCVYLLCLCYLLLDYPLLRIGCNKVTATFIVFAFSAAMHELVISLPFRYISFHAFAGMMAQAPLIFFANYIDRVFDNPFLGNAIFWCSFCIVGQPMAVMLYYYEIVKMSVHPH